MHYTAIADTDIGNSRKINQDSLLIEYAKANDTEILMAVVCDGMGGLSGGELASATVVRGIAKWFHEELPQELERLDMEIIGEHLSLFLKDLNLKLFEYGKKINSKGMGTTCSIILFIGEEYVIVHVGDSRIYELEHSIQQLTTDHTFVAREISRGTMTLEEAKKDKRRNLLYQCIGASKNMEPQLLYGRTQKGGYLLCSDGFRHEITEAELYEMLCPTSLKSKNIMHEKVLQVMDLVKKRQEKDNISAILIKTE